MLRKENMAFPERSSNMRKLMGHMIDSPMFDFVEENDINKEECDK